MAAKKPAATTAKKVKRIRRRSPDSGRLRKWLRRVAVGAALIAAVPLFLTSLYVLPFVKPVSTLMLKDMVTLSDYDRRWVDLDSVAPVLVTSVTMSEDGQFCSHYGIDFGAINEVLDEMLEGGQPRGASTIPMQTVKNLFLWQGRSYVRKAFEAPLALLFDAIVPKKRIMEIYLNIAEWGPGIFGIEAAAQRYFGRPAADLNSRQAALLAVTLPNPAERNPAKPSALMNKLASIIEKRARHADSHVRCLVD